MPRISAFYGIVIFIYFADHDPPHFHARYAEHWARFNLDGALGEGSLPVTATRLIRTWAALHQDELEACWERARNNEAPGTIEPLT
jgi:hypothetical protein